MRCKRVKSMRCRARVGGGLGGNVVIDRAAQTIVAPTLAWANGGENQVGI